MDIKFIFVLIGMALVTYIPRIIPALGLSRVNLPDWALRFLDYIPVAVLSALLFPSIMMTKGRLDIALSNPYLIASIPTVIAAYFSRNLFIPVIVGIVSYIGLTILYV
ncbi:MAG: AzlD domain-containing protein [Thermoanaerobacteraceae bacterium]|nr:AzlD domain-containing protein [Thermoanaerobacteraceae bacterium]